MIQTSITHIIFDLGGVMVRVNQAWEDAASNARVRCANLSHGTTPIQNAPGFDAFQAGQIDLETYQSELGQFLGCTPAQALAVHNGILGDEYPGSFQLVLELMQRRFHTGCLSNTNAPHWEMLISTGPYPAVQALEIHEASHLLGYNKPDDAIFEAFCKTTGVQPEQILFFDDHPKNTAAANRCGWAARLIDPAGDPATQIRRFLSELGMI